MKAEKEIKTEMKEIEYFKKELIKMLKNIRTDWGWLSDFDTCWGNIHNSIIWIIAMEKLK